MNTESTLITEICREVLPAYGFIAADMYLKPFGSGLINHTWKFAQDENGYIIQRINSYVFKEPSLINYNIREVGSYLKLNAPFYKFIAPIETLNGQSDYISASGTFRIFPFVNDSHSVDVVQTSSQAFEAAAQFGLFTKMLSGFDAAGLKVTLPHFHDLPQRYFNFLKPPETGNQERVKQSASLIIFLKSQRKTLDEYLKLVQSPLFKVRVTHHDAKISNVLFDSRNRGLCVIDLDTTMPGYFVSDLGDMIRTYVSPAGEEEFDFSKIEIRDEFFYAVVEGYMKYMKDELTSFEKNCMMYAGKFMIYMQALRFITDYINDDAYYGQKYEGQNFVRATNQAALLRRFLEKEDLLAEKIGVTLK